MKDSHPAPVESRAQDPDERRLVARCREGDPRAFRILVGRYQNRAYGLALRLLRSAPDAEEVTQDAFVRAWKGLADFRGDAAFGTWLYRIVWRRALDRAAVLKLRGLREAPLEGSPALETADEAGGRSRAGAGGLDEEAGWERLTQGLTEPQRAVITLFYYQDLSVKGIARALEMPEGTVKTHLSRARAALREQYQAVEAGGES